MKELSLNILDIANNSIKAGADRIDISIKEENGTRLLTITDNGCGIEPEKLRVVTDPFYTTRTTRKVGMGIALLKLAAEQTGGWFSIDSVSEKLSQEHGTTVKALFYSDHIDCVPTGDITASIVTLIQGSPDIRFVFTHSGDGLDVNLDTQELKDVLGDIPLNSFEVLQWIEGFLSEQYGAQQ